MSRGLGDVYKRQGLAVGANWKPQKDLTVKAAYHTFSLFDKKDGWYGVGGGLNSGPGGNYIDPAGLSGDQLGSEFDLTAKWQMQPNVALEGGIGIFKPGSFVKSFLGGKREDNFWGYVGISAKF